MTTINDELRDVSRIGSRVAYTCGECGGTRVVDANFLAGSNVSNVKRCPVCHGSGVVWYERPPQAKA